MRANVRGFVLSKKKSRSIDQLLGQLNDSNNDTRCRTIRGLCPCRSSTKELALWDEVFSSLLNGGRRERNQAAHVIGTLIHKASKSRHWREVLVAFADRLDAIMANPPSAQMLLAQMKRHGHAHRGAAMQAFRKRRQFIDLSSPAELAAWVNKRARLRGPGRVQPGDPGLRRLWRWHEHRGRFQPERGTRDAELLEQAARFLPQVSFNPRDSPSRSR